MTDTKRVITVDDFEHRLLVGCINKARTEYMEEGIPVDDVNDLLLKTIDAPTAKGKKHQDFEAR